MQHLLILSDEEYAKLTASNDQLEAASVENFKHEVLDYLNDLNRWWSKRAEFAAREATVHGISYTLRERLDAFEQSNPQPTFPSCLK